MKVLNFLEWVLSRKEQHAKDNSKKAVNDALCDIYGTQRFYSQPFKPEMITELFENASQSFLTLWVFSGKPNEEGYQNYNVELGHENYYYRCFGIVHKFPNPQTLNDFISDCQRAGIELTWKPEIINKYFK